jgi:hypothetical protein
MAGGEAVNGITAGIGLRPGTSEADIEACLTQTLAAALTCRRVRSSASPLWPRAKMSRGLPPSRWRMT